MYHKSRYRARKKYYEKEENKEKKRIYMRAYDKRPYVIFKKRKHKANDLLHAQMAEIFVNYEKETRQ
tara:strand:- start:387 stop:587 length:201 start_codon:yes stop_codon:yes gene_type:complete